MLLPVSPRNVDMVKRCCVCSAVRRPSRSHSLGQRKTFASSPFLDTSDDDACVTVTVTVGKGPDVHVKWRLTVPAATLVQEWRL